MGTHVDFKIGRRDVTAKGEPRWLVRVYEGAYRLSNAAEVEFGAKADELVYEREKVLRECEVVLPVGSTDEDLRAYMNAELTKHESKLVNPAQVTGGKGADPTSAKVPVVVRVEETVLDAQVVRA